MTSHPLKPGGALGLAPLMTSQVPGGPQPIGQEPRPAAVHGHRKAGQEDGGNEFFHVACIVSRMRSSAHPSYHRYTAARICRGSAVDDEAPRHSRVATTRLGNLRRGTVSRM